MSLDFWTANSREDFARQLDTGRVVAIVPSESNCPDSSCGWDELSQSAKRLDCPTCGGRGKIVTLTKYHVVARVSWNNMVKFVYANPSSGVEIGDCVVTVGNDFRFIMDLVLDTDRAYLMVDDKIVRPKTGQQQTVGAVREYEYGCNNYTPPTY